MHSTLAENKEQLRADPVADFVGSPQTATLPSFLSLPTFESILPILQDAIRGARRLPAPSSKAWTDSVKGWWASQLKKLSAVLLDAIAAPSELNLFNACFALLATPGLLLSTFFQNKCSHSDCSPIEAAIRKITNGQEKKAFKLLCSNGVAPQTDDTFNALRSLHPDLPEPLVLPEPVCPQLVIDPATLRKKLFDDAADREQSKDVFGWTASLFAHERGTKDGFLDALVAFGCFIAEKPKLFPSICSTLLSSGFLTPLHKLSHAERKEQEAAGLDPRIRPINSGTMLTKAILYAVLNTPAAERTKETLAPYQLSQGTTRGIEKLAHVCRAAYHKNFLIGRNDFANGFNTISRQNMLDTHAMLCPEAVDIFNFFYGIKAPAFFIKSNQDVLVIWSSQGSRQGCSAGCEAFCVAIHPVLLALQEKYPEFHLRVYVDDLVPLVPPPTVPSAENWNALYRRYAYFLQDLQSISLQEAGLRLNLEKAGLLLPPTAAQPTAEVLALFGRGFAFSYDGFKIGGAPIGSGEFIQNFVSEKMAEGKEKLDQIAALGKKAPKAAHRLLISSASKLFGFLASVTPPQFTDAALKNYDGQVSRCFMDILDTDYTACSSDRVARANLKLCLPQPYGCGLFYAADYGKIAWLSSIASCLNDPLLFQLRDGISQFIEPSLKLLIDQLGGRESQWLTRISQFMPISKEAFLDGSVFNPDSVFKTKLTKCVLRVIGKMKVGYFHEMTDPGRVGPTLSCSDIIASVAVSDASRIFAESTRDVKAPFSLSDADYKAYTRFYLGLPPPAVLGNAVADPNFDYPVEKCMSQHGVNVPTSIDASANHTCSNCPSTYVARARKHNNFIRVIMLAAKEAGLIAKSEPDSHSLLLGEFSKQDCRRLFPKQASKKYKVAFDQLVRAFDTVSAPQCTLSKTEKDSLLRQCLDAMPPLAGADAVGLRIDLSLESLETGEIKWVDVAGVHTTANSYIEREIEIVFKRRLAMSEHLAQRNPRQSLKVDLSPTVVEKAKAKSDKYSRLLLVARKQLHEGKRPIMPVFCPFIVSDFGEMGADAENLQEWIISEYRRKCKAMGTADGIPIEEKVRRFRRQFKMGIQLALASGLGQMINFTGFARCLF